MNRRTRMLLLAILGPALLTVAFSVTTFGALYLPGQRFSELQIEVGSLFFFGFWQLIAIGWLWKHWKGSDPSSPT